VHLLFPPRDSAVSAGGKQHLWVPGADEFAGLDESGWEIRIISHGEGFRGREELAGTSGCWCGNGRCVAGWQEVSADIAGGVYQVALSAGLRGVWR
jgi:hypothetical protein